jgi:hypothetical protein
MKIEVTCSTKTSVDFQWARQHYTPVKEFNLIFVEDSRFSKAVGEGNATD